MTHFITKPTITFPLYLLGFCISFLSCKTNEDIFPTTYTLSSTVAIENKIWISSVDNSNPHFGVLYYYDLNNKTHKKINFKKLNIIPQAIMTGVYFNKYHYFVIRCWDMNKEYSNAYYYVKIADDGSYPEIIRQLEGLTIFSRSFNFKIFYNKLYLQDSFNAEIYETSDDNLSKKTSLIYKQISPITDFYIIPQGFLIFSSGAISIQDASTQQIFQIDTSNKFSENLKPKFHEVVNGLLINHWNKLIGYNTKKKEIEFIKEDVSTLIKTNKNSFYISEKSNLVEYNDDLTIKGKSIFNGNLLFIDEKYIYYSSKEQSFPIKLSVKSITDSTQIRNLQLDSFYYQYSSASLNYKKYLYQILGNQIVFFDGKNQVLFQENQFYSIPDTQLVNSNNSIISVELVGRKVRLTNAPFTFKNMLTEFEVF